MSDLDARHETAIESAVIETVADAAAEAVDAVRTESAIEDAAERVEDAADRVHEAADAHAREAASPDIGAVLAEHLAPIHSRLDGMESRLPPVVAEADETPDADDVAEAVVDEIVERASDAEDAITDDTPDVGDVIPDEAELPESVADVADDIGDDTPPRPKHWMQRPIFGRRG